jgi:peptide-methionine (S)-S-oxide reductase
VLNPLEEMMVGGGCFWCVEAVLAELNGVVAVQPGYAGGHVPEPTYEQVCTGRTGHAEVVHVRFQSARLSFSRILEVFFHIHDPTTLNRQGHDVGSQYRSVVFCASAEQRAVTHALIARWQSENRFGAPIVTEVVDWAPFWPAEPEHHDYYRRNPEQVYCRRMIAPKLTHVRHIFAGHLKTNLLPESPKS